MTASNHSWLATTLLLLASSPWWNNAAESRHVPLAFVTPPPPPSTTTTTFITSATTSFRSHHTVLQPKRFKRPSARAAAPLFVSLLSSTNETTTSFPPPKSSTTTTSMPVLTEEDVLVTKNTLFPLPPPPPTTYELHTHGLPILVQAAKHAEEGRMFCYELPENGCVSTSYRTVMRDATRIADFITKHTEAKEEEGEGEGEGGGAIGTLGDKPRTVAHLTEPGSEYVSSMFGTWAAGFCTVPLATSHRAHEFEHVLKDADPDVILIGGHVTRFEEEEQDSKDKKKTIMMKTLPPHNEGELLQAVNAVGMADRVVYLRDLIEDPRKMGQQQQQQQQQPGEDTAEESSKKAEETFNLGAHGSIPSLDSYSMIMYTSGTTGLPKGVLTTHRNIYHQITDLVSSWEWQPTDVALHLLPLHHVHGAINILSCAAYAGACCEFRHFRCADVWKRLAEASRDSSANSGGEASGEASRSSSSSGESQTTIPSKKKLRKPNVLMAVPTIYSKMLEAYEHHVLEPGIVEEGAKTLSDMRLMISGSAALPVSLNEKWRNLTGHILLERYGMTEFAMALSNPYRPMSARLPGYVGTPLPSVEVRIVDEHGNVIPPESGESGELQVRGPHVFQCYLNRPDVTAKEFADDGSGFFKTGDITMYDKEKKAYKILGRASVDIIKNGGHKLSALEIERDLLEHPFIAELAVLGIPDETWGERVAMVCRMKDGEDELDLETLRCWAEHRMARYKVPSRIVVVDDIPKNAMGKINKKELKKMFFSDLAP